MGIDGRAGGKEDSVGQRRERGIDRLGMIR
jgi:hypothetical protein